MKKAKFLAVLISLLLLLPIMNVFAATPGKNDYVIGNGNFNDNAGKPAKGATTHYFGPWSDGSCLTFSNGDLIYDTSDPNGYMTMNFDNDFLKYNDFKYCVITMKTADVAKGQDFALTLGFKNNPNAAKAAKTPYVQNQMNLSDWILADGGKAPKLTTSFQSYCIDMRANHCDSFGLSPTDSKYNGNSKPDIALNPGAATNGNLVISQIFLTNTVPAGVVKGVSKPSQTSSSSSSSTSSSASSTSTTSTSSTGSSSSSDSAISSDTSSSSPSSAVSGVSSVGSTASHAAESSGPAQPFNWVIVFIVLAAVIAAGTVAAIFVVLKRKE